VGGNWPLKSLFEALLYAQKNLQANQLAGSFYILQKRKEGKGRGETGGRTYGET